MKMNVSAFEYKLNLRGLSPPGLNKDFKIRLTESMIHRCPISSKAETIKENNMYGFCKGAYWKSLTPNTMSLEEPIVPDHLVASTKPKIYLMWRKERNIIMLSDSID